MAHTVSMFRWGEPHYYPDSGRLIIVPASLRSLKRKRWQEFRDRAYGEARFRPGDEGYEIIAELARFAGVNQPFRVYLVGLVTEDGQTVHFGSLSVSDDGTYTLAG